MLQLALKYRPKNLKEIIGHEKLLSPDSVLTKLVKTKTLSHTFFYGPPGSGKTTLARVISSELDMPFYEMNASTIKVDDLRKVFKKYEDSDEVPLIFIDEVHRLSKNQQEVLLPFMEDQKALIIGASTENPYYSMTSAMRSRSHMFRLESISNEDMAKQLTSIMKKEKIKASKDAKEWMVFSSGGDLRGMLNLLESAAAVENPISLETLKQIRPHAIQLGSAESESHYDLTSAMIKSIRGSDVDAGLYYLARLIDGGEPAEFIARRLAILASEDVGNANPNALNLASSTLNIVMHIGYPEARISLAQLVVYLASSPKSNSAYMAINKALADISQGAMHPIPGHLKTHSNYYKYPHDHGGWVKQKYMEAPKKYYETSQVGFEKTLYDWVEKIKGGSK